MKNIYFIFSALFFSLHVYAATPKEKVYRECIEFTDDEIIENKAPKCKKAISVYLQKVIDDKIPRFDQGLYSFLWIGLRADLPQAYKLIEKEIYEGHLNDWIDKLEELNFDMYAKSLTKWARHVESVSRKIYKVEENKKADYTALIQEEKAQNTPELMSVWSPILMQKYLDVLILPTYHVEEEDFESINIIYAFSTPSFRDIFAAQTAKVILKASDKWVKSIRKEQAWVLFRLLSLIPKTPDGNIKRELLWLEKYHKDFRIRALASTTLTKIEN